MLVFTDGCSHYDQANLSKKWDIVNSLGNGVTQSRTTNGRFGGGAITFTGNGGTSFDTPLYIQKNYDGVSTIIIGVAVQQIATQNTFGGQFLQFLDGNWVQLGLAILPSGQIQAFRANVVGVILHPTEGAKRIVLGTSTNSVNASSYDHLEIKVVFATGIGGSIEIKRNGLPFWTLTNINTASSGVANNSSIMVGGYSAFGGASISMALKANITDFHIVNTIVDGSQARNPIDFIGDRHWASTFPTADGADKDFINSVTGNTTGDHFANVDEPVPNTTDFNSSNNVGDKDSFVISAPAGPSSAEVFISANFFAQKTGGGSNELQAFIRNASPAYKNGTGFQVPVPWAVRQSFICEKVDGSAITLGNIASLEVGYEKTI